MSTGGSNTRSEAESFGNRPGNPMNLGMRMQSLRNRIGFALRNFMRWSPIAYRETAISSKTPWHQRVTDSARLDRAYSLLAQYNLSAFAAQASPQRCLETLSYLEWLDAFHQAAPDAFARLASECASQRISEPQPPAKGHAIQHGHVAPSATPVTNPIRWLDVGAKNWSYVTALAAFLKQMGASSPDTTSLPHSQAYRLDGVELDPNRRYADFRTRHQAAEFHIGELAAYNLPEAAYHPGDILDWQEPAHVISHFLPFVFEDPLLAWGLPLRHFDPERILAHLLELLLPGGVLLIVNQGPEEAMQQGLLINKALSNTSQSHNAKFQALSLGELPPGFIGYNYPRYGWLVIKDT